MYAISGLRRPLGGSIVLVRQLEASARVVTKPTGDAATEACCVARCTRAVISPAVISPTVADVARAVPNGCLALQLHALAAAAIGQKRS
mmetsp:Transcript_30379/g.92775  ORF Transcript_30379/g.92775 Transcript_30379/m.92775 type:complete len:89 (+) Transcript_30379:127-393(+)|eukprot:scaffold135283_cov25-Tisochrysis_lutea.AAC.2